MKAALIALLLTGCTCTSEQLYQHWEDNHYPVASDEFYETMSPEMQRRYTRESDERKTRRLLKDLIKEENE